MWKAILLFSLVVLFITPLSIRAQDSFIGTGTVINANATGNVQLSGLLEQPVAKDLGLYALTFADVSGIKLRPFDTTQMQFSGSQALAYYVMTPAPWLRLGLIGEAGLSGTVGVTTGAKWGGGGIAELKFKKNISVKLMPKVLKDTISGTQFELRVYPGIRF